MNILTSKIPGKLGERNLLMKIMWQDPKAGEQLRNRCRGVIVCLVAKVILSLNIFSIFPDALQLLRFLNCFVR